MIVKNNWLNSYTLKSTREQMIKSGNIDIVNYPKQGEVFSGIGVSACIFSINTSIKDNIIDYKEVVDGKLIANYSILYNGLAIFKDELENTIVSKLKNSIINNMGEIFRNAKYFGINTNGAIGFTGGGHI